MRRATAYKVWDELLTLLFTLREVSTQNWVNLPTQALIADRTPPEAQGRVYGAHFAWSHLWWALAYPLAGWLGSSFDTRDFLYGGLIGLGLLITVQLLRHTAE